MSDRRMAMDVAVTVLKLEDVVLAGTLGGMEPKEGGARVTSFEEV